MPATVSAGIPGPLSAMMISRSVTSTRDHRGNSRFLGGVESVVDQFLENDQRPLVGAVADLLDQFTLGAEIEQA